MIGVCGCDSRPNPGEWDVGGIEIDGLRELDEPVSVIGDVDVLGPANVDIPGPIVTTPRGVVVAADVEVAIEDEE